VLHVLVSLQYHIQSIGQAWVLQDWLVIGFESIQFESLNIFQSKSKHCIILISFQPQQVTLHSQKSHISHIFLVQFIQSLVYQFSQLDIMIGYQSVQVRVWIHIQLSILIVFILKIQAQNSSWKSSLHSFANSFCSSETNTLKLFSINSIV